MPQQIISLSEAVLAAAKVLNAWGIWDVVETTLQSAFPERGGDDFENRPDETTARGALQFLASNLVYQRAQSAAGSREMWEGHEERQRQIADRQRRWAEETRNERMLRNLAMAEKRRATIARKKAAAAAQREPVNEEPPAERPRSTAEFMMKRQRELRNEPD